MSADSIEKISVKILKGSEDLSECCVLRRIVFIEEQNVPEEYEWDGLDSVYTHYLLFHKNHPIGTARAFINSKGEGKLGRFCLLKEKRHLGLGQRFLLEILNDMKRDKNLGVVNISAQTYVRSFYEKAGFKAVGEEYLDCNIPHVDMVLNVK